MRKARRRIMKAMSWSGKIIRRASMPGILGTSLAVFCLAPSAPAGESHERVYPIETPERQAVWEANVPIRRVVDEPTGRPAVEYAESNPTGAQMWTDFDWIDLDDYDALVFEWKMAGDSAHAAVMIEGYPEGRSRNYYLRKRPNPMGQWQTAWLDLTLDDDGLRFRRDVPEDKIRLRFSLYQWDRGEMPEVPRIVFRVANIRFVRFPVRLSGDQGAVQTFNDNGRIGQRYPMTLTNQTDEELEAALRLDDHALDAFSVELPAETMRLQPGEERVFDVEIAAPAEKAGQLPPLYSEYAQLFVSVDDDPDTVHTWMSGYMLTPLTGALPIEDDTYPRLYTDAQRESAMERTAAGENAGRSIIARADDLLDIDTTPPELRHGYSGHHVNPEKGSTIRFRGPGKHWCEGEEDFIDMEQMPLAVRKAGAYAHHNYLVNGARTLAQAWWLTDDMQYARKAADILLAYAERYPDYDSSNWYENQFGWRGATGTVADGRDGERRRLRSTGYLGRIGHGNLGDAWWFDGLPEAVDLTVASGVLSDEERKMVIDDLLIPGMLTLRAHRSWANQQAEYNYTYGTAALTGGHWPLAAEALDGEAGMRSQWESDFDADGWSDEQDTGYHFASLGAFTAMAARYEAAGVNVFDPQFKRLFDAPLAHSIDQDPRNYRLYLTAYEHYRDTDYLPLARRGGGIARLTTPLELDDLPDVGEMPYTNSVLEAGGYSVLRAGTRDEGLRALSMNWGMSNYRGGRVLLDPEIVWQGQNLNRQIGRIAYGYDESAFSYRAVAGNSVIKDGRRHTMHRAVQEALIGGDTPAGRWTSPLHRPQYRGVEWSRTAAILGDTFLLVDQIESDEPARFDWITYLPAGLMTDIDWAPYPELKEQGDGYNFFKEPQLAQESIKQLRYALREGQSTPFGRLTLAGDTDQWLTAKAPAGWHPSNIPVMIRRVEDRDRFWMAAAYSGSTDEEATGSLEQLKVVLDGRELLPQEALGFEVDGKYVLLTSSYEGEHQVGEHVVDGHLGIVTLESEE